MVFAQPLQKFDFEKRRHEVIERKKNEDNHEHIRKELMLIKWEIVRKKRAELMQIQDIIRSRKVVVSWWVHTAFKHMLVKKF